eukprot:TRINITY_DN107679_c0_g1_i1.p1 TRINITY_DN107679_c0_g1~~TRINITY_DN107679_c0_g1_i1.p1  ORF type:complete len:189 (-),score=19.82 TRINITY_DN107679_c0_g1_i1:37-552(-)
MSHVAPSSEPAGLLCPGGNQPRQSLSYPPGTVIRVVRTAATATVPLNNAAIASPVPCQPSALNRAFVVNHPSVVNRPPALSYLSVPSTASAVSLVSRVSEAPSWASTACENPQALGFRLSSGVPAYSFPAGVAEEALEPARHAARLIPERFQYGRLRLILSGVCLMPPLLL